MQFPLCPALYLYRVIGSLCMHQVVHEVRLDKYWRERERERVSEMLEGKAVVRETDMEEAMQSHVMELAYQALDLHEVSDCQSIAHYIKQKFDEAYGAAWHCVVGKEFGSCVTHLCGSFMFFRVDMMEFLVFKDGKDLTQTKVEAVGVMQQPS